MEKIGEKEAMVSLNVDIPLNLRVLVRLAAADQGLSIKEFVRQVLAENPGIMQMRELREGVRRAG